MNLILIANAIVFGLALISFIYGATIFFKPKKALYGKMITFALLCIVFGRLFNVVRLLTNGNLYLNFQLGSLGIIGSFMFFFSSNYGTIDSLVDDGSKEFMKYRLIGCIAPAVSIVLYFPLFFAGHIPLLWKVQGAVLIVFVALCSYYHLKHIVIPDVDFGVLKNLRPFNLCALAYMCTSVLEFFALSRRMEPLVLVSCCMTGVFLLAMIVLTAACLNYRKKI